MGLFSHGEDGPRRVMGPVEAEREPIHVVMGMRMKMLMLMSIPVSIAIQDAMD